MIYILGILIILTAGFLAIRLLTGNKIDLGLHLFLSLALGFGIAGTCDFYTHILFNQFNHRLPIALVILATLLTFKLTVTPPGGVTVGKKKKSASLDKNTIVFKKEYGFAALTLAVLSIPLVISANHYPLGGWDAWSCWGLKAKFIFLGAENWKDMMGPDLWRSNTHYPLLWPLINVWFWDLSGHFNQAVPMLNSIIFALLTAGILLLGIWQLTSKIIPAITAAVIATAIPFGVVLSISQYSDSLLGLYLLCAFLCLLLAEKYRLPKLKMLSMVFLGLMSFTKNEGLIAAGISMLGILWHERRNKKELVPLIAAFIIAALPTIIFTLFMAPKNEAFINGLTSSDKPSNLSRLCVILAYPWFEFISAKWCGFWLLVLGGILLAGKKIWQSTLGVIAISLILYVAVVLAYYEINTFFEITWWLSTTLSRILFALVPTIILWVGLGLAGI